MKYQTLVLVLLYNYETDPQPKTMKLTKVFEK
jgi:hypothetical protein